MLPTFSRLLYEALDEDLEIYADNYGDMTPEEWETGQWFVDRDDERENWREADDDF